jgi:hypothetical protein
MCVVVCCADAVDPPNGAEECDLSARREEHDVSAHCASLRGSLPAVSRLLTTPVRLHVQARSEGASDCRPQSALFRPTECSHSHYPRDVWRCLCFTALAALTFIRLFVQWAGADSDQCACAFQSAPTVFGGIVGPNPKRPALCRQRSSERYVLFPPLSTSGCSILRHRSPLLYGCAALEPQTNACDSLRLCKPLRCV